MFVFLKTPVSFGSDCMDSCPAPRQTLPTRDCWQMEAGAPSTKALHHMNPKADGTIQAEKPASKLQAL